METGNHVESRPRRLLDDAAVDRCDPLRRFRQLRIRFNAARIESLARNAQKVASRASDLEEFSSRPGFPNQVQPPPCIEDCQPVFLFHPEMPEVDIGCPQSFLCVFGFCGAESQSGSSVSNIPETAFHTLDQRPVEPARFKYKSRIRSSAQIAISVRWLHA